MDADALAQDLMRWHEQRDRFRPFAAVNGAASLDDAYAIQERFVALLRSGQGEPVGYKIGLTSQRMQAMCGIDSPVAGVVFARRVHRSGASVAMADYGRIGLEFEIAVRMAQDLDPEGAPFTAESVARHVGGVCAAIEIVDDRACNYAELEILSLVADNSWNAGIVLSEFRADWPPLDGVLGIVSSNGVEVDRGHGRDVLGHPFEPLAWLANRLAAQGKALRAGEIVMTGSLVTTRFPTTPEAYEFAIEGLGKVSLAVTG